MSNAAQELRKALEHEAEHFKDMAESIIHESLKAKDLETAKWFLTHKGKDRGYATRVETTGADGGPIAHTIGPDISEIPEGNLDKFLDTYAKACAAITSNSGILQSNPEEPGDQDLDS